MSNFEDSGVSVTLENKRLARADFPPFSTARTELPKPAHDHDDETTNSKQHNGAAGALSKVCETPQHTTRHRCRRCHRNRQHFYPLGCQDERRFSKEGEKEAPTKRRRRRPLRLLWANSCGGFRRDASKTTTSLLFDMLLHFICGAAGKSVCSQSNPS